MRLAIFILLFQGALTESPVEVIGYAGDVITLRSGADTFWNLTDIEWSIFSNTTFIATYRDGVTIIERFHQYKGRLALNTTSGDLTISNLTLKDAMTYTVELFYNGLPPTSNTIKLTVRQRLQKPDVRTQIFLQRGPVKTGCWIEVLCSSSNEGVEFSWQVHPSNVTNLSTSLSGSSALLLAFINSTQVPVEFTCSTSKNMEETSNVATSVCEGEQTQPTVKPQRPARDRQWAVIAYGIFIGCLLSIVLLIFCREQNQTRIYFFSPQKHEKEEDQKNKASSQSSV